MTVHDPLRDLIASRSAQAWYRQRARELVEQANDKKAIHMDLSADLLNHYAFIALNAARVEFFDPDPRFIP